MKKLVPFAIVFLILFTFNTKAQDLEGKYTIQRAIDGILNKNAGTVEIKKLVYIDTGRIYSRNELGENDRLIKMGDLYYKISKYIPDDEYEFIEFIDGAFSKRKVTVRGNGSGSLGNEVELSCPLTNPQNHDLSTREELEYRGADDYLYQMRWRASLEPGVIVIKHWRDDNPDQIYDITEILVKQGSAQEQSGTVMSQWLIDVTKSTAKCVLL
jgi:hypothetical protein